MSADDLDGRWPLKPDALSVPTEMSTRPKPTSSATEPYNPVKALDINDSHAHEAISDATPTHRPLRTSSTPNVSAQNGMPLYHSNTGPHTPVMEARTPDAHQNHSGIPRYPYTPDSARMTKSHTLPPLSPLPPMPWAANSPTSPVQNALISCISHLDNLIQTRQPNDDQMEYLVSKFEEMAQYLSAPEAQSRQSDDHLFSELELPSANTGLGISGADASNGDAKETNTHMSESYVLEVGKYIDGVKKYAEDLKMRMDEVKQLNSIQLDIINDLRQNAQKKEQERPQEALEAPIAKPQNLKKNLDEPKKYHHRKGFWAAIGEALDAVGEMLHEW